MRFSLLQPLSQIPLTFLDVETTGASADLGDGVIEIGIERVEGGKVVATLDHLIDPQRRIGLAVQAPTGITPAMVAGRPTFAQVLPEVWSILEGSIPVGHNIPFDLSFLRKELRRCGTDLLQLLGDVPALDTVRIARKRFGRGGNAVQLLCRRLDIVPDRAHRALDDVRTTRCVFEKLIEPIGGWNASLADVLMAQGGPVGLVPANPRQSQLPLELEEALDLRRPVMMEYLDANDARTQRVVEPVEVRKIGGELVLIAFCQLRQARRNFKLDRIVQLVRVET